MSTNTEDPLDRLNYYNGQRLEAADLRVEQDYHIRVRRLLNKSLYTAGIVQGLEVDKSTEDSHAVVVSPGVAFDVDGREIILLEEITVKVHGVPSTKSSWVYGNYLTIEYDEETTSETTDGCTTGKACDLAWGGPTRIRATPKIEMQDAWPTSSSGKVILAQIELDESCAVADIHTVARSYVETADNDTSAFVLEGEKTIALGNDKNLSFVVEGAPASSVTLYLWGEAFPSMFYTEVGKHDHEIPQIETAAETFAEGADRSAEHSHTFSLSELEIGLASPVDDSKFDIKIPINLDDPDKANSLNADKKAADGDVKLKGKLGGAIVEGYHTHALTNTSGLRTDPATTSAPRHTHLVPKDNVHWVTDPTGQESEMDPRTEPFSHIQNLQVILDGTNNITEWIVGQLQGVDSNWDRLGSGSDGHLFTQPAGTGAIALDQIGDFNEGLHTLTFRVGVAGDPLAQESDTDSGGNLRYLLYVK